MSSNYDDIIRQAMGMQPTMTDASEYTVDVGDQQSNPVFSDKEWRQGMLWNQMDTARMLYGTDPGDARKQAYDAATHAYMTSQTDPSLPANQQRMRLQAASTQSPIDADVMMKAIEDRQRQTRR
jgi:hypothetical protein